MSGITGYQPGRRIRFRGPGVAPGCFQKPGAAQALDQMRLLAVAAAPVAAATFRKDRRVT